MFDITSGPGDAGHGSFGSPDNSNGYRFGRGRLRGEDFGLTARPSLLGLARTYLETQARLWPELAGTLLAKGGWDYALVEALKPQPGDLVVPKPR
jgi:nicotinamidase-related amidase